MTTVAASTSTHFLLNGVKYPISYRVFPSGSMDARLEDTDGSGSIIVESGATVGGTARITQAALVDALAAIVTPASAGGGGGSGASAAEIGQAVADAGPSGTATEFTGSIATGGTAVTVAAVTGAVERWLQNTSSGDLRVRLSAAGAASSTAGAIVNPRGVYLWTDPKAAVSVWGETTGQTWAGETR